MIELFLQIMKIENLKLNILDFNFILFSIIILCYNSIYFNYEKSEVE